MEGGSGGREGGREWREGVEGGREGGTWASLLMASFFFTSINFSFFSRDPIICFMSASWPLCSSSSEEGRGEGGGRGGGGREGGREGERSE